MAALAKQPARGIDFGERIPAALRMSAAHQSTPALIR
jgi:hypothetical protein